jgi:hypothetical protein
MRLERDTSEGPASYAEKETTEYNHSTPDPSKIHAYFHEFGGQKSRFWVHLDWDDVERAIQKFAELGNENAFRLQKARKLAEAVSDYLASTSSRQSN